MTPQLAAILDHVLAVAGLVTIGLLLFHAIMSWQPRDQLDSPEQRRRRGLAAANRGRRG